MVEPIVVTKQDRFEICFKACPITSLGATLLGFLQVLEQTWILIRIWNGFV